jgi:hypothetical protein
MHVITRTGSKTIQKENGVTVISGQKGAIDIQAQKNGNYNDY